MESPSAMLPSSTLSVPLKLLDQVIKLKVTDAVYEHLVQHVTAMVKVHSDDVHVSETSATTLQAGKKPKTPPSSKTLDKPLPKLHDFIENISIRSRCTMSTMLVALIYLDRLQKIITLNHPTVGKPCARHRVIFSALMISHKIWNDSSMIGKHWAEVSNLFTSQEVLAMEREILVLLRYDLELTVEEIWTAARPFLKKPFLAVSPKEMAEAKAAFAEDSRMKYEATRLDQLRHLHQHQQQQILPQAYPETTALPIASVEPATPICLSQQARQPSHEPQQLLHPFSSLNYSSIPLSDGSSSRAAQSACSSPAPFDPFETPFFSPALKSSPLLTSPSLQANNRRPAGGTNPGTISFSRTHTTRSSAGGSTTRTTTRLTVRNIPHVTVASKGTSAHPYLHNHPHQHPHGHPIIAPGARFKKKKSIASIQRFHLPTSMHMHSTLRSDHSSSSSPYVSSSGSSSVTTSIPSSPSSHSAGSSLSVYAHSPSMVWYALPQEQYNEHGQPYYSYASTITLPPVAATGP